MKRSLLRNFATAVALTVLTEVVGVWPALAADAKADSTDFDPAAITALDRMGAYVRTLTTFQIEVATQREEVLDNGLKVQFAGIVRLTAQRPDRLWLDVSSDRQVRQYFYDGKQFTLWAPRVKFYATVPAPPTILELVTTIQERFGIEAPLADIFRWGTDSSSGDGITLAMDIGPSRIGDTDCRHYAYRQQGLDWQIWIQDGDAPLPRKLVITTTTDEARPQYQATYTWNLTPTIKDQDFTFDPPADAHQIAFEEMTPGADENKKE